MKKLIVLLFIVGAALQASAQVQFALGIKAGPNFANIDTKSNIGENYKNRTGFHGGAFALVKLTKIGIQPEIIFSQQGSKVEISGESFETNFSYVNIPVLLKLYLVAGLNLQAGPQFGFVTKAEGIDVDEFGSLVDGVDIKDDLKGVDISAGLGLGWDAPFGLTLDARYNLGLSDVNDRPQSNEAKNQVFQISLGYKLLKFGK